MRAALDRWGDEIRTWIAGPWQRTAVNTEAKYLQLRHLFELGANRVSHKYQRWVPSDSREASAAK